MVFCPINTPRARPVNIERVWPCRLSSSRNLSFLLFSIRECKIGKKANDNSGLATKGYFSDSQRSFLDVREIMGHPDLWADDRMSINHLFINVCAHYQRLKTTCQELKF